MDDRRGCSVESGLSKRVAIARLVPFGVADTVDAVAVSDSTAMRLQPLQFRLGIPLHEFVVAD
jgi:hypothetical protein